MTSAIIEIFKRSLLRGICVGTVFLLSLSTITFITSCSSGKGGYESLVNQGILPVSPTNAYLGSNLYLGEEASKSQLLYQFLKGRGVPGAVEISQKNFKHTAITLYYPKQAQFYLGELEQDRTKYEWIIRGPYAIERSDYRKLIEIEKTRYEAAPLIVNDQIMRFVEEQKPPTPQPSASPTPKPKLVKKSPSKIKPNPPKTTADKNSEEAGLVQAIPTSRPVSEIPSGPGLNSDQQAIRVSKGLVELTAEGDLLIRVQKDSESLEDLASWYAGDSAQAKTIAEFNGLAAGTKLAKGAKIKIPKAISKTDQVKPASAENNHN